MNANHLKPNHRILLVDDNPGIHADFRKILCPNNRSLAEINEMEAALFDDAPPATDETSFELES
ncbi:MAG TPA: hybrid sensor histidine kinase/response regulator, partial [Candidatus Binatia bacterium]|nr:hybrid sensor histidine kinase/response regulator [Candidatus Binatia bacterium]